MPELHSQDGEGQDQVAFVTANVTVDQEHGTTRHKGASTWNARK